MGYIRYFPDDDSPSSRKLKKVIEEDFKRKDKKNHLKLINKLNQMDKIGASYVFNVLKEERNLKHSKKTIAVLRENLYELRVPKQKKEGVFRIYFTIFPDKEKIMILEAEYKTEKEPKRLKCAESKLKRLKKEANWNE